MLIAIDRTQAIYLIELCSSVATAVFIVMFAGPPEMENQGPPEEKNRILGRSMTSTYGKRTCNLLNANGYKEEIRGHRALLEGVTFMSNDCIWVNRGQEVSIAVGSLRVLYVAKPISAQVWRGKGKQQP